MLHAPYSLTLLICIYYATAVSSVRLSSFISHLSILNSKAIVISVRIGYTRFPSRLYPIVRTGVLDFSRGCTRFAARADLILWRSKVENKVRIPKLETRSSWQWSVTRMSLKIRTYLAVYLYIKATQVTSNTINQRVTQHFQGTSPLSLTLSLTPSTLNTQH